jgi:hypothetical protein
MTEVWSYGSGDGRTTVVVGTGTSHAWPPVWTCATEELEMMLRKISLVAAVAASLFIPASAFGKKGGGGGGWQQGGGKGKPGSGPGGGWQGGGGHHGRRFWHGRWWDYGVGPCWRITPAGYIWICG